MICHKQSTSRSQCGKLGEKKRKRKELYSVICLITHIAGFNISSISFGLVFFKVYFSFPRRHKPHKKLKYINIDFYGELLIK